MKIREYYLGTQDNAGNKHSDIRSDIIGIVGEEIVNEYLSADIFLAAFGASVLFDSLTDETISIKQNYLKFLNDIKDVYGDNFSVLDTEIGLINKMSDFEAELHILDKIRSGYSEYSPEIQEHIKEILELGIDENKNVEGMISDGINEADELINEYAEATLFLSALEVLSNETIHVGEYRTLIDELFRYNSSVIKNEIELLNEMSDFEAKLHILDKIRSGYSEYSSEVQEHIKDMLKFSIDNNENVEDMLIGDIDKANKMHDLMYKEMNFDQYYVLASKGADEGKDLSELHAKAMGTFGEKKLEEYVNAEIFFAALNASGVFDSLADNKTSKKKNYLYFLNNIKKVFGDDFRVLNDEIDVLNEMSDIDVEMALLNIVRLGYENFSDYVNEHIKERLKDAYDLEDVNLMLTSGVNRANDLFKEYVDAYPYVAALEASGVLGDEFRHETIDVNEYIDILNELKGKFGDDFDVLTNEIELLNRMSVLKAKLHILDKISSGYRSHNQLLFIIEKIYKHYSNDEAWWEIYLANHIAEAGKTHNIIIKSEMYLAALNASGVMNNLGEKILHPDEIKDRYMNSLKDINSSEYDKIRAMSPDKVALSVFKIVKEGPEYLILEALSEEGFISDYSREFIAEQKEYMVSKLKSEGNDILDPYNSVSSRLYTYMGQAERNYKTLILPEIYRKIAIGSTTAGTLIFTTPFVAILLGNIFPAWAAAFSILAASTPIFAAVGISLALLGVFYLKDEKNNVALKNSQLFTSIIPIKNIASCNSRELRTDTTGQNMTSRISHESTGTDDKRFKREISP